MWEYERILSEEEEAFGFWQREIIIEALYVLLFMKKQGFLRISLLLSSMAPPAVLSFTDHLPVKLYLVKQFLEAD